MARRRRSKGKPRCRVVMVKVPRKNKRVRRRICWGANGKIKSNTKA